MVVGSLEMLSGRGKKEYAREAQAVAETGADGMPVSIVSGAENADEAALAM